eukprot:TRINITY_DN27587_c0_g1_i1.p1 TRINITY_DN27587_c0_g1~~TRINITY_DN27587_c0_g1_i1.p1  ORF type:complete len:218 (+),score=24.25 TRINITY_DN27587_c0_g1_i1:43-696(+)
MSYAYENKAQNPGWFRGAWYVKPWYVNKQKTLPEVANPAGILGPKGMEWPEYPGGYKPTWEDRAGVPGLYKPTGAGLGGAGYPAIRVGALTPRTIFRGGPAIFLGMIVAVTGYSIMWVRLARRYAAHLRDEEGFRNWSHIAYDQANIDALYYTQDSKFDMFCREHMDHIPGVNRNFYNQEEINVIPFTEHMKLFNISRQRFGDTNERPVWWEQFLTA